MASNKIINIISNKNKQSKQTTDLLIKRLEEEGYSPSLKYNKDAELNICVGGDGAFLRAVRRNNFPRIPFIGINTGHLGFYQEISPDNIDVFIDKYIKGNYEVEKLYLVQAIVTTTRRDYTLTAINEIVLTNTSAKVIHINVDIDDYHLQKFSGDGLIVSSPSGSTAYNYSAGGSIVFPTLKTLQMTPVAPINTKAYRSLDSSYVLPGDIDINMQPTSRYRNSTLLLVDGEEFCYKGFVNAKFNLSSRYINRIILDEDIYWNNLKNKFL